jgi:aminoglycoside phosphotransferase
VDRVRAASREAPDLVPRPLEAGLADDPPWVTMSRLRGEPLDGVVSATQLDALELALRRMWSVPVGDLPPRRFHPEERRVPSLEAGLADSVRPDGVAGQAYDVCVAQLQPADLSGRPVIGHGDANLANYLWDGVSIRLVDFEDAGVSSVEYELGVLAEHLSGRGTDWDSFLRRFDTDEARLRSARLTSATHWLLLLLNGPATRCNPAGTLDEQARHILSLA